MIEDKIIEWRACGECGRIHHDPDLRLLNIHAVCPTCGKPGFRQVWPGFSLDALANANGDGFNLSDERMLRALCILTAASAEAMLWEVLFRIATRRLQGIAEPTESQFREAEKITEVEQRWPRLKKFRELTGVTAKDAVGPAFASWWESWEFVVDHRNAFGHGSPFRKKVQEDDIKNLPAHIARMQDEMLPAFAAMTNAAMEALYPIVR